MLFDVVECLDEGLEIDGFGAIPVGEACFGVKGEEGFGFVEVVLVDYCAVRQDFAQVARHRLVLFCERWGWRVS